MVKTILVLSVLLLSSCATYAPKYVYIDGCYRIGEDLMVNGVESYEYKCGE